MQLLFERSEEMGGGEGLAILRGEARTLAAPGLKVPQIGWNEVSWRRDSPLTRGLSQPCAFYHVHSFGARPADADDVLGTATYGEEFCSVVERGRVFGVQFHPEKSGDDGLRLLANFSRLCTGAEPDAPAAAGRAAAAPGAPA